MVERKDKKRMCWWCNCAAPTSSPPCARLGNVWTDPEEGDYYVARQDTGLPPALGFTCLVKVLQHESQTRPRGLSSPRVPSLLTQHADCLCAQLGTKVRLGEALIWLSAVFFGWTPDGEWGKWKSPVLIIIHIHAVEFAPVCSERGK